MKVAAGNDISDEPTRLERLVSKIFSTKLEAATVWPTPNASATLLAGVPEQDDCAVYALTGEQELVVGSDYVRGPKFRLYQYGLLSDYDLGYYLAAANISDVAAMGARPIGLLTVVRYPPDMTDSQFASVLEGIRDACTRFQTLTVGGDIGGAERLILSATALGVCRRGASLRRRGTRAGDVLCITGPTGIAGAAMQYFRHGATSTKVDAQFRQILLDSWKRPTARVREGIALGEFGSVTACQDTSDGLKAAATSIAAASGVGFVVDEHALPVAPAVMAVSDFLKLDPTSVIMGDSVDFQLLFTIPENELEALRTVFDDQGMSCQPIGQATVDEAVLLRTTRGDLVPLPGDPWRHAPDALGRPRQDHTPEPEHREALRPTATPRGLL